MTIVAEREKGKRKGGQIGEIPSSFVKGSYLYVIWGWNEVRYLYLLSPWNGDFFRIFHLFSILYLYLVQDNLKSPPLEITTYWISFFGRVSTTLDLGTPVGSPPYSFLLRTFQENECSMSLPVALTLWICPVHRVRNFVVGTNELPRCIGKTRNQKSRHYSFIILKKFVYFLLCISRILACIIRELLMDNADSFFHLKYFYLESCLPSDFWLGVPHRSRSLRSVWYRHRESTDT